MRYLELLEQIELVEAARDRYVGMLNFFDQLPQTGALNSVRQWADGQLEWAVNTLRNSDRITWFMRYVKIIAMKSAHDRLEQEMESLNATATHGNTPAVVKRVAAMRETLIRLEQILEKEVKKMDRSAKTEVAKELQLAQQQSTAGQKKLEKVQAKCQQNPNSADCGLNLEALESKVIGLHDIANILGNAGQETIGIPEPGADHALSGVMNSLGHFESINYQPMQDYRFGSKPINVVVPSMAAMERQWADKQQSTIAHDDPQVDKVLDFGDGKAWFNLHRSYCDKEGAAMGHCGNDYDNMDSEDEVLSFRTLQGVDENGVENWKPHLTFIYDTSNGMLGEMKGRNNTKPTAAYHPYIVPLLQQDWVKGIVKRPHQHAKQNDFYLSDLPEEQARKLAEEKPNLLTYKDRKALGMDASMDDMELDKVNETLEEHNIDPVEMFDEDTFMLDKWANKEHAYKELSERGWPDEYSVEDIDADQTQKMFEFLDDETKNLIRAYAGLAHTDEAKEYIEFDEEEEERDFALSDLSLEDALEVLHQESDDVVSDIIGDTWKKYHTEGMQDDAGHAVDNITEYGSGEYEFDIQDRGESNAENNFDPPLALTMDMDYFFDEIFPKLEEIGGGHYRQMDWKSILKLFVYDIDESYWENFNEGGGEGMQYFVDHAQDFIKNQLKERVAKLKEHDAYDDMMARKLFLQRQGNLGLNVPDQPKEPAHKGSIPTRQDIDLDL